MQVTNQQIAIAKFDNGCMTKLMMKIIIQCTYTRKEYSTIEKFIDENQTINYKERVDSKFNTSHTYTNTESNQNFYYMLKL